MVFQSCIIRSHGGTCFKQVGLDSPRGACFKLKQVRLYIAHTILNGMLTQPNMREVAVSYLLEWPAAYRLIDSDMDSGIAGLDGRRPGCMVC